MRNSASTVCSMPPSGCRRRRLEELADVTIQTGCLLAFADYLERTRRPKPKPVLWRAQDIEALVPAMPACGRGSEAMSQAQLPQDGAVAPGLSLTIQSVQAGTRLPPHRHSFWHLYTVLSGTGHIVLEETPQLVPLAHNDGGGGPAGGGRAGEGAGGPAPRGRA